MTITLTEAAYEIIEQDLQTFYDQSHWNRLYENGKKFTQQDFIKKFTLECSEEPCDRVRIALVSKEGCHKAFDKVFERFV